MTPTMDITVARLLGVIIARLRYEGVTPQAIADAVMHQASAIGPLPGGRDYAFQCVVAVVTGHLVREGWTPDELAAWARQVAVDVGEPTDADEQACPTCGQITNARG